MLSFVEAKKACSYTEVMDTTLLEQARRLSVEDQLALVEALWDDLAVRNSVPLPTEAQKAELDRRLADHEGQSCRRDFMA